MTKRFIVELDGTDDNAVQLKNGLDVMLNYKVVNVTEEVDAPVTNGFLGELGVQYANTVAKMEMFIDRAIASGVPVHELKAIMTSEIQCIMDLLLPEEERDENRTVATVPPIGTQRVCDDCGVTVVWVFDEKGVPGWSSELSLTARQITPWFICGGGKTIKLHYA